MATNAEKIIELEAELSAIKTAMLSMVTSGQSHSMDGTSLNKVMYTELNKRRSEIDRQLARLNSPTGGITGIDFSQTPYA